MDVRLRVDGDRGDTKLLAGADDPEGDFAALIECNLILGEGGMLFLGIPASKGLGCIWQNQHRVYGPKRLNDLIARSGFTLVDVVGNIPDQPNGSCPHVQPIFVLKKTHLPWGNRFRKLNN